MWTNILILRSTEWHQQRRGRPSLHFNYTFTSVFLRYIVSVSEHWEQVSWITLSCWGQLVAGGAGSGGRRQRMLWWYLCWSTDVITATVWAAGGSQLWDALLTSITDPYRDTPFSASTFHGCPDRVRLSCQGRFCPFPDFHQQKNMRRFFTFSWRLMRVLIYINTSQLQLFLQRCCFYLHFLQMFHIKSLTSGHPVPQVVERATRLQRLRGVLTAAAHKENHLYPVNTLFLKIRYIAGGCGGCGDRKQPSVTC